MNKKLTILVIFVFFLSTVGLPISMHICKMQGSTSFSACEMHSSEKIEKENPCCQDEDDYSVQLNSANSDQCCSTRIIEAKVKDNFLSVFSELRIDKHSAASVLVDNNVYSPIENEKVYLAFTDSSPPRCSNHIYILNSTFLI